MITALYTFIALLALVVCIAIISTRSNQRRNKTTKLDNEIFRRNNDDQ